MAGRSGSGSGDGDINLEEMSGNWVAILVPIQLSVIWMAGMLGMAFWRETRRSGSG